MSAPAHLRDVRFLSRKRTSLVPVGPTIKTAITIVRMPGPYDCDVPKADISRETLQCPLCANSRLVQCSNWHGYSITPSASPNSDSSTVTRGWLRREPAVAKHRFKNQ